MGWMEGGMGAEGGEGRGGLVEGWMRDVVDGW